MRLSIVIPVLNEADGIEDFLSSLQSLRQAGHEIIVANGGSSDRTAERAAPLVDQIIQCPRGRAAQMNAGATLAHGDVLLFLHADCQLPDGAAILILDGLKRHQRRWGRFDIKLSGDRFMFRVVEWFMNTRSRLSHISTGDQALFVERELFTSIGSFPLIPLMEDIAMTKQLKQIGAPLCVNATITTSSRRWEKNGVWHTIWLMWRLRYAYWRGVDPVDLARIYYPQSVNG
jgi:rSAM/selenodomain-associated transferase 2